MKANDAIIWSCGIINIVDDGFWFVPYEQNLLCRFSIEKNLVDDIFELDMNPFQVESFDNVYQINNKVFMIPAFEKYMHVFDMNQRNIQLVNIPEYTGAGGKFLLGHQYEEWLYLFPSFFDKIIKVNVSTLEMEEVLTKSEDWHNEFVNMVVKDNKAYLVNKENKIYLFDFESEELSVVYQFKDISGLRTVSIWNDKLIVTGEKGKTFVYDLIEKKETLFAEYGIEFIGSYCVDSFLFLVPILEKDFFLRVNLEDRCLQKIKLCRKDRYQQRPHHPAFSRPCVYRDCLYFFNTQYRTLIKYNYLTEKLEENCIMIEPVSITRDILNDWLHRETEAGNSLIEGNGPYTTLNNLIAYCINN